MDCWANSSDPPKLLDVIIFSRVSNATMTCSGWWCMTEAIGAMHSNRDRASTQMLLVAMGFRRLNKRTVTVLELEEDDKSRNNRGNGPSAGMCSDKTGWLCNSPEMAETTSLVFSVSCEKIKLKNHSLGTYTHYHSKLLNRENKKKAKADV